MPNPELAIATPVPDNLMDMSLEDLHKLHAQYWDEHAHVKAKRAAIKPAIDAKQLQKDLATRAGFDNILQLGPKRFTLDKAKQYLSDMADGIIGLPANLVDRLKKIVDSGRDEE